MTDLEAKLERFETLVAECDFIAKLAMGGAKRELYLLLACITASWATTFAS